MSQPHPPIPEPQPHPDPAPHELPERDDPRTQSILLPPSQRQAEPFTPEPEGFPPAGAHEAGATTRSTGPVDVVPGLPAATPSATPAGSSAVPPPPPVRSPGPATSPGTPSDAGRHSRLASLPRAGRSGHALPALALGVLAVVLLQLGLALDFGSASLWEVLTTWSTLATVASLVALVPAGAALTGRLPARTAWRVGAAGVAALALFWVLVALPVAASDRGFWLTAALATAGAALWLAPGRTE